LVLWQITSTERLKARAKAIASQRESLCINALIIMMKLNKATITVRAFLSFKYFLIFMDLHGLEEGKNTIQARISRLSFGKKDISVD
jgi:hypothetical protein